MADKEFSSPDDLVKFLEDTGKEFLVFKTRDLVNALKFPDEVQTLRHIMQRYAEYRQTLLSGASVVETIKTKDGPVNVEVPLSKTDALGYEDFEEIQDFVLSAFEKFKKGLEEAADRNEKAIADHGDPITFLAYVKKYGGAKA